MKLSKRALEAIRRAVTDEKAAAELTAVLEAEMAKAAAVAEIADTGAADAEEVGDKVNELIQALKAAELMES
jgi:hypothetical protein